MIKKTVMTKQQAFDKVWKHFVVDRRARSTDDGGACAYRGARGTKCAAGVLIPDSVATPKWLAENNSASWDSMSERELARMRMPPWDDKDFHALVSDMQFAHDSAEQERRPQFTAHMRERLTRIAGKYGLEVPGARQARGRKS